MPKAIIGGLRRHRPTKAEELVLRQELGDDFWWILLEAGSAASYAAIFERERPVFVLLEYPVKTTLPRLAIEKGVPHVVLRKGRLVRITRLHNPRTYEEFRHSSV